MKKRICSLLLTATMFFSGNVFAEEAQKTETDTGITPITSRQYYALKSMELLTDEFLSIDQDAVITRAQFVGALHKLAGFSNNGNGIENPFTDVTKDTPYSDAIVYFYNAGIVSGAGNNMFFPDEPITYTQAFKMSVSLLGYTEYVESVYGDNIVGYSLVASKLGLDENLHTPNFDRKLVAYDAIQLLLNCGLGCIFEGILYTTSGEVTYGTNDERYLFSVNHGIYYKEGILSGNGVVALDGTRISYNEVIVDGKRYRTSGLKYADMLGSRVQYFLKDVNGTETVLWMMQNDVKTDVIEIPASELLPDSSEYGFSKIVYRKNNKEHTADLYRYADIVYNNELKNGADVEILKPKTGSIRLLDNDGDKEYETVVINEFDNILIQSVAVDRNILVGKHNTLPLEDYDVVRIEKNGEEINLNEIPSNSLLSYIESPNKDIIFIYLNDKVATEKLVSISQDQSETEYEFEGGSYVLSHTITKRVNEGYTLPKIELGTRYKYYLDMSGEIGAIESTEIPAYTLLVDAAPYEKALSGGNRAELRMVLSNGEEVIVITAKKLIIDGVRNCTGSDLLAVLGNPVTEQVVKAYFNVDGELREIEIAKKIEDLTSGTSAYGYNKDVFSLDYTSTGEIYRSKTLDQIGPRCRLDGNTICFIKYEDAGSYEYDTVQYQHFGDNVRFNVKAYDYDECFTAGAVIIDRVGQSKNYKNQFYVVDDVKWVNDHSSGETYILITGYNDAGYQQYKAKDDGRIPSGLKRGDIGYVALAFEDPEWIDAWETKYRLSVPPDENTPTRSHELDQTNKNIHIYGAVYSVNSKAIVTYHPNAGSKNEQLIATPYKPSLGLKYLVYNAREDRLYYASNMEEIRPNTPINPDGSMDITDTTTMVYIRRYNNSIDDLVVAIY